MYKFGKKLCTSKDSCGGRFNEVRIAVKEGLVLNEIKQFRVDVSDVSGGKLEALVEIYQILASAQSVVFVGKKAEADRIQKELTSRGISVTKLHGNCSGDERDRIMEGFRNGGSKVLLTTDVLARGVDVPATSMVVNYDLPVDRNGKPAPETYLHRIGRCGRFGRKGCAFSFVDSEKDKSILAAIQSHFKCEMAEASIDDAEELEELVKECLKH